MSSKFTPSRNYVTGDFTVDGNIYVTGSLSASSIIGGGSTSPGAPVTSVQFNDAGAFAGDADFTWDKTSNALTVTGDVTASANISGAFFYGDGSGLTNVVASSAPAGSNTEIQFNADGAAGADADFIWTTGSNTLTVTGDISGSGNVSGSDFYGGGANLTDLNASSVSAGTLDTARLPATISVTNVTASNLVSASLFYGDGSNLTNVGADPAGSNTEIQFNADGVTAADADFTWLTGSNTLSVTGIVSASAIAISGSDLEQTAFQVSTPNSPNLFQIDASSSTDGGSRVMIRSSNDGFVDPDFTGNRGVLHIEQSSGEVDDTQARGMTIFTYSPAEFASEISLHTWNTSSDEERGGSVNLISQQGAYPNGGVVVDNQKLGQIQFGGDADNGVRYGAMIQSRAIENWSFSSINGADLRYFLVPRGKGYATGHWKERIRMTDEGHFIVFPYSASNDDALALDTNYDSAPGAPALQVYGPTLFGSSSASTHIFTGSVNINGDLSASINVSASAFYGDGSGLTNLPAGNAAGSDTEIQFNDGGTAFGADPQFTWNKTSNTLTVTGDVSASVNISGSSFYGDGSNLTNLPAGSPAGSNTEIQFNADGAFGADPQITWASGSNTLTVTGDISASVNISGSAFYGDGSNLTNLPSAAISVYDTPGAGRIITSVNATTVEGEANLTFDNTTLTVAGDVSGSGNISGSAFYGDGSNLTNLPAGNAAGSDTQIQFNDGGTAFGGDAEFTWNKTSNTLTVTGDVSASVNVSGSDFYGGGANLTDLNASNISAGTLNNARLPATISVTNVSASTLVSASSFYGDASNLTGLPVQNYNNATDNFIITAADSNTVQGEANLTFDGTTLTITGDVSGSGNISGSAFYGDGANLTDLNASNVSAGTLANARLPSTISVTNVTASTLVSASSFYGDGSNLTNLPAGSSAGSDTEIQFNDGGSAFGGDPQFTWNKTSNTLTVTGDISASVNISGSEFYGDGSNLTGLPVQNYNTATDNFIITAVNSNTVQGEANLTFDGTTLTVTGDVSGSGNVSGSAFYGDGANLTALNASNVSAGTLDNARLPATISVTNVTASNVVSASFFHGDGSNLKNISATASPAGSNTQIQFNDDGSLAADAQFTWLTGSNTLGVVGAVEITGTFQAGSATEYHSFSSVGSETSIQNSTTVKEVTTASDFPQPLTTNTTYMVRGDVLLTTPLTASTEGISIHGYDRNRDILRYHGTEPMIMTADVNFTLSNLGFRTSGSVLSASNITPDDSSTNFGRVKVLSVESCEIRNSNDVWDIVGYELADIKDVLCWYISGSEASMAFQSNRHLEINSCEIFNWHNEAATPSIYSSGSNIEFKTNVTGTGGNVGFAVVNMAGNIIHPVQNQDGLFISTGSTTRFGTIAGNTFIDVGQVSGDLFAGSTYDSASALNYDIAVNQGIADSITYAMSYFTGVVTQGANATYTLIDTTSGFVDENSQRMTVNSDGEITYNGTKSIFATLLFTISGLSTNNSGIYDFTIFRSGSTIGNNELSGAASTVANIQSGDSINFASNYVTEIQPGEKFGIFARETGGGGGCTVNTVQFSIKE